MRARFDFRPMVSSVTRESARILDEIELPFCRICNRTSVSVIRKRTGTHETDTEKKNRRGQPRN